MENQQFATSIAPNGKIELINHEGSIILPTWSLLIILVVCLVILKGFIYIKDKKRSGL
jgi:hypothetical protein